MTGMNQGRQVQTATARRDVALPGEHARRRELSNEVHARPFARLQAPERATHLAMLTGEDNRQADEAHLVDLCQRYGVTPPGPGVSHVILDFGAFRLKWERHTEFCSYTVFQGGPLPEDPFAEPALTALPADWVAGMPGELLAAANLVLESRDAPERPAEAVIGMLSSENFAASAVSGGAAVAFMDFAMDHAGFSRIYVRDRGLRPRQAGRLVQRLLEVETYRMLSLLALPLARRYGRELGRLGRRLSEITGELPDIQQHRDERRLLEELTRLSAETERIASETAYRFAASRAYYELVERRIRELREARVEGFQVFSEFMERRMAPAMHTCAAVRERQETLSRRVNRATQLLLARVDVELEEQNADLLLSMDRRAKLQLRLQQTVEGLSVAAITYYAVGLVNYAGKGLTASGLRVPVDIATGLAVPLVAGLVWFGVRRARRMIERQNDPGNRKEEAPES